MTNLLHKIFDASQYDKKTLTQKALKLAEECGEVAQAMLSYTKAPACAYKGKTKDHVIEECCDCIITAASIIHQVEDGHVDEAAMEAVILAKLKKWIEKSTKQAGL
jgi:NTP pyrophosphatase (non-canonical NTP hydrolase)